MPQGTYKRLQTLKRPTDQWDDLLVHIVSSKLDSLTVREWQSSLGGDELPMFKQLNNFVARRCRMLEASGKTSCMPTKGHNTRSLSNTKQRQAACLSTVKLKCSFCRGEHSVYNCKDFLALSVSQRSAEIRKRKICFNCLRSTEHRASDCPSGSCKICKASHNTLLHASTPGQDLHSSSESDRKESSPSPTASTVVAHTSNTFADKVVMLSTAIVHAFDNHGSHNPCRVLLDCGSQANFVSSKFLRKLQLKPRSSNISIFGINGSVVKATQMAQIQIRSRVNSFSATIDCIVTDKVTDRIPVFTINRRDFALPPNLKLVDPKFNESADIDTLIGADLFWQLLCIGQVRASEAHPMIQKTRLGWVLAGRLCNFSSSVHRVRSYHATTPNDGLSELVTRLWRQEDLAGPTDGLTHEEVLCEKHFVENVSRDSQSRYTVKLSFKESVMHEIGESREIALKRLYSLEKRFNRDPDLKSQYASFIGNYSA